MIINWIHTLILTHISDVEAATVRAVVRGPAQQELVACSGEAKGCFNVTTERCKVLTVDVGTWIKTDTQINIRKQCSHNTAIDLQI